MQPRQGLKRFSTSRAHGVAYTIADTDTHADAIAETNSFSNRDAYAQTIADTDADADPNPVANTDSDRLQHRQRLYYRQ